MPGRTLRYRALVGRVVRHPHEETRSDPSVSDILLIEPGYASKFPPLGLLRLSTYHKQRGDSVTFARGKVTALRDAHWDRIYIASLFTWELPRTVDTIRYYRRAVSAPSDIVVGGVAATLMPQYIRDCVDCQVVTGPLDRPGMLGPDSAVVADLVPDYDVLDGVEWRYRPEDAYFCRITKGCIRRCSFCAVPLLEPTYGPCTSIRRQIRDVVDRFGERQNLVILDNNILAMDGFESVIADIVNEGFGEGAHRNGRLRYVDFNQGLDARLITDEKAEALARICLSPVRLAFDFDAVEPAYRRAVKLLATHGFREFTNYVLYNYNDTPESLYRRLKVNIELSVELGVRVTGFPMRFTPMDDVRRQHVSSGWHWRYLRGLQCILQATRGLVSPNASFFTVAFGETFDEFARIVAMPDRYIIHRERYQHAEAAEWRKQFGRLSSGERSEFLSLLQRLNASKDRKALLAAHSGYGELLAHYYPNGKAPEREGTRGSHALPVATGATGEDGETHASHESSDRLASDKAARVQIDGR